MTSEEFKMSNFKQVRRNNLPNQNVFNVKGINDLEGLVLLDQPSYTGEVWVRYENVDIITKIINNKL